MSGCRERGLVVRYIPMIWSGSIVPLPAALLTNWSCGCAKAMEAFVGFCLVSTRYTMKRGRLSVGILRVLTLTTAKELKRHCKRKTFPSLKKSRRLQCLETSLEHLLL